MSLDLFNTQVKIGIDTKSFVDGVKTAAKINKELSKELNQTTDDTKDLSKEVNNEGKQAKESAEENKTLGKEVKTAGDHAKTAASKFAAVGTAIKNGVVVAAKTAVTAVTAVTGASTAMTAALIKGVDSYTSYGDNIDKMSQKLNMSATAYQEWAAIMEHSGTSIDSLQASIKTLANAVENENEAFGRLGITQEEIASMNNEQLFSRTITALQNVENETERTYLAGQLLGRGATELGALLNTSAEDTEKMRQRVHELGGVMSDEAVKASAKYKDSIQDLKTAFAGMGRGIISDFVPAMTMVSDGLTAIFTDDENGAEIFMQGFNNVLSNISRSAGKLKPIIKKIASVAADIVPDILTTVGNGILKSGPLMLDMGKNVLKSIAEGIENASLTGGDSILGKIFDSIVNNAPDYFKYSQQILTNISNQLLNVDYKELGSSLSTVFTSAVNSITDFVKSIDFYKVGENIADFLNAIDWQNVANSVFDFLASGIKAIPDIAVSFFANADLGNLVTMIGLLSAPKLLGSITDFVKSSEGQSLGTAAGMSWSNAFMAGIKAFGLGWAIGTWIRDNVEIGGKTVGEWVDYAFDHSESQGDRESLEEANKQNYGMFTTADGRQGLKYDVNSNTGLSDTFIEAAKSGNIQFANIAEKVQAMQGAVHKNDELSDFYFEPHTKTYQNQNDYAKNFAETEKSFIEDIEGPKKTPAQTQNVSYGIPASVLEQMNKRYSHNAIGNYVTEPQISWVAEKEPEYIIPESKMNDVYPRQSEIHIDKVEFIINGAFDMGSPEDRRKLIEELSSDLQNLSIAEQRALGGAGWR